ncbi:MAG: hypothetical protein Q9173_000043 [Seirophora scorigena]
MGAPSPQAMSWPAYQIASVPGDMVSQVEQAHASLSLDHHHPLPCWPSAESLSGQKQCVRPLTTEPPSWQRLPSSTQRVPTEIHYINPPSPNTSPKYHPRKGGARGGMAQPIRPRNIDHNSSSPSRFSEVTSSPEEAHDGNAQRTSARTTDYISYWPNHSSHANHSQKEVQGGIAQGASAGTPHLTSYSPNPSLHTNFHQKEAQRSTTQLTGLEFTSTSLRSPYPSPKSSPDTEEAPGGVALLSPVEFAYDDVDDNFGRKVCEAYLLSQQRQEEREERYGVVIAREWKRGSTPIQAREAWEMELERRWEALSNSSEDDGEGGTRPKQRFQPG